MAQTRPGSPISSAVFWFLLSVVVMFVNFRSATRGSWLALLLGILALYGAIHSGKVLLDYFRSRRPQPPQ